MVAVARVVVVFAGLVTFAGGSGAQVPTAPPPHLPLDTLVKEYQRLGLPLPPPDAPLVRIDWYRDEEDRSTYLLGFRLPPSKPEGKVRHLIGWGGHFFWYFDPRLVEPVEPTPELLSQVTLWGNDAICLAVQCKLRGWNDLADALYERAREQFEREMLEHSVWAELRDSAWRYWANKLVHRAGDRTEPLRRLKELLAIEPILRTDENLDLVRGLELTLAPRKSNPGSVESLIDDLTEYWADEDDPFNPAGQEPYWKLVELGFDSVPTLIEHLGDDRQSRTFTWGHDPREPYKLTVGHLCSRLLFDLSARTIGGYRHRSNLRLDPDKAREWFAAAKKVGEEKWLLGHAIPPDGRDADHSERPEPLIVRVIGAKYPDRLPAIYRAMLGRPASYWLRDYVPVIVASKLPRDRKIALLVEGATHDDLVHRLYALDGMAQIDTAMFRKHLLQTLKESEAKLVTEKYPSGFLYQLIRLIEQANDPACWDTLAAVTKKLPLLLRLNAVVVVTRGEPGCEDSARRERLRFLLQFLDDRERTAERHKNDPLSAIEVRDFAASKLAELLGPAVQLNWPYFAARYGQPLGPFSRLVLREVVRQVATRELAGGGK